MKKILILNAHPYERSFCDAVTHAYFEGAKEYTGDIRLFHLRDLKFDPILHGGYREKPDLEPDLVIQQNLLKWCDHLVVITPMWWLSVPALLKGYFDRVFMPGFAFQYHRGQWSPIPEGLLKDKSVRVIYSQDSNKWIIKFFLFDSFWRGLKYGIFYFCGFRNIKRTIIHKVKGSSDTTRRHWLQKIKDLGKKGG